MTVNPEAMVAAMYVLEDSECRARIICYEAIKSAEKIYHETVESAKKICDEAEKTAREICDATLKAIDNKGDTK